MTLRELNQLLCRKEDELFSVWWERLCRFLKDVQAHFFGWDSEEWQYKRKKKCDKVA